jgi:hypothetical protein
MIGWHVKHIGFERDGLMIGGLSIWDSKWREVGNWSYVDLPHPAYADEVHRYWIYEIGDEASPVRFASGELSPGVYGFYVPDEGS